MNEELVLYRLSRAREALDEAKVLSDTQHWNAAVSRLYYACFYAVSALLLKCDLASTKHTGVRSLFNKHFVKTAKVSRDIAMIYNDLFERRQESDYDDFLTFEADDVRQWSNGANLFVSKIVSLIDQL